MCEVLNRIEARGAENKAIEDAITMIKDFNIPKESVFEKMKLSQEQILKVEDALKSIDN